MLRVIRIFVVYSSLQGPYSVVLVLLGLHPRQSRSVCSVLNPLLLKEVVLPSESLLVLVSSAQLRQPPRVFSVQLNRLFRLLHSELHLYVSCSYSTLLLSFIFTLLFVRRPLRLVIYLAVLNRRERQYLVRPQLPQHPLSDSEQKRPLQVYSLQLPVRQICLIFWDFV